MSKEREQPPSQQLKPGAEAVVTVGDSKRHLQSVPRKTGGSGQHKLALDEVLRTPESQATIATFKKEESVRPLRPVTPLPPAPAVPGSVITKRSRDSKADLENEVGDATVSLTDSVDSITEAMLLILGNIQAVSKTQVENGNHQLQTSKWVRASGAILLLCLPLLGAATYLLWRTSSELKQANERISLSEQHLADATDQLSKLQSDVTSTKEQVKQVKDAASDAPKVEVVQDKRNPEKGVIRFVPQSGTSKPTAGVSPAPPVEIPIDLGKAQVKDPPKP